jgi:hypothetical protein
MEALLGRYKQRGVANVDLRASENGELLYRALGFVPTSSRTMRLTISSGDSAWNVTAIR